MQFDFWTHWGAALNDADFARAWVALGIAAGAENKPSAAEGPIAAMVRDPNAATAETGLAVAREAVGDALSASRARELSVRWSFPDPAATVDADARVPLARIEPATWARAWADAMKAVDVQARLRVVGAPGGEPVAPWFRLLVQAQPAVGAASLVLDAPRPDLAMEWPLRLGTLGGTGDAIVATALAEWPSARLARAVALGRDNANCDVLVHAGDAAALLAALLSQPFRCKANVVLIAGAADADAVALEARLRAIAAETCASGIVLWASAADPQAQGHALNALVEEFSHDAPLDRALHVAAQRLPTGDAIAWLTEALAGQHLRALADRLTARVRALPAGTAIDVSRLDSGWVRSAPEAGTRSGAGVPPGGVLARVDAASVAFDASRLNFDSESRGASELAMLTAAVAGAQTPPEAEARRAARYLQQQSFVRQRGGFEPASAGFLKGRPALVRVRIGPSEGQWQSLPTEFPSEALPPDEKQWRLAVWLTEPAQLSEPLRKTVILPAEGPSTECDFRFTPQVAGAFEGRLTVLHRGRVLQTAVLRTEVAAEGEKPAGKAPALLDLAPVRRRLGDLDQRRQFDLAFVTNHTTAGEPRGVALSADRAWIADVSKALGVTQTLNTALSRLAKSVDDYKDGLAGEAGRKLLVDLAKQGAWLDLYLVHQQLARPGNRPDVAAHEYIQVVSTKSDAIVPFEFIYDQEVPDDDARPCAQWRDALEHGQCPPGCAGGTAKAICPLGFWGLRKVIERHQVSPEHAAAGSEYFLQSEPGRDTTDLPLGGTALFASSTRVPAAAQATVTQALAAKLGSAPLTAGTWADWATMVGQASPHLLIALTHTDGTGANVTLEIGGNAISTIQIKPAHLRAPTAASRPLVALLGCDTVGTANDYGEHVVVFRDRGAAVVVGTIATVFGEHAARVAVLLAQELVPNGAPPQRLGEAIRALKRRALLDGLLMPLCVVAYGDADWNLVK